MPSVVCHASLNHDEPVVTACGDRRQNPIVCPTYRLEAFAVFSAVFGSVFSSVFSKAFIVISR